MADFVEDRSKQMQWNAFVRQAAVAEHTPELSEVARCLREFLEPVLVGLQVNFTPPGQWQPTKGWQ